MKSLSRLSLLCRSLPPTEILLLGDAYFSESCGEVLPTCISFSAMFEGVSQPVTKDVQDIEGCAKDSARPQREVAG